MLPVLDYNIRFLKPAFYDDLLKIKISIRELPSVRIKFDYETHNEAGVLLNEAKVTLVFIDMKRNKPCAAPLNFIEKMREFF